MTRYIIGIDLGTTNCALAYIDTEQSSTEPEIFSIPQVVNPGMVQERRILPSFLYLSSQAEMPEGSLELPWDGSADFAIGEFAQKRGAEVPDRLISSAKSWLCHGGMNRMEGILPWNSTANVEKLSPLDVSTRYLKHIIQAWNHRFALENAEFSIEKQDVFLTVPASFDAEARELTAHAAKNAGLENVTLLEEPQAAFYSWLETEKDTWRNKLKLNDLILICDVGGGTTDFSLIRVCDEEGNLGLERIAVGDHILLGGDNMDLALAHSLREQLAKGGTRLNATQMLGLLHQCRINKEIMLNDPKCHSLPVTVLGRGSSVIGGTLKRDLERQRVQRVILDGFFPEIDPKEHPTIQSQTGLRELGLPYSADPAITRHLAKFLSEVHLKESEKAPGETVKGSFLHPSAILFNGGVMKAGAIQNRLLDWLNKCMQREGGKPVEVLNAPDIDLAVARGAVGYGLARRGKSIRIRAGASRTYYVGIETAMPAVPGMAPPLKALCVVPFGMEEGSDFQIPERKFGLMVGQPSTFRFLSSTTRREDKTGDVIEEWEEGEIIELTSLEADLPVEEGQKGALVPVRLHCFMTEVGALEIWCESTEEAKRWKLQFNIRGEESRPG